nr:immunoglobulin heavy chain junction region [Macaca mulatta]MOV49382.1 immunoglobulin heavy chain junction region [Macaca mulatta]MOV49781.1 immunoglobulin heavy chain junction region [Macaca mulatta]MOV50703.1 immunoglobulin heavy chain junction region [Macaca mulatta]MOV50824.1 immunoglobulin heavy chain junction region [Macaca mulatta]
CARDYYYGSYYYRVCAFDLW